jgi:hypothetical protein
MTQRDPGVYLEGIGHYASTAVRNALNDFPDPAR